MHEDYQDIKQYTHYRSGQLRITNSTNMISANLTSIFCRAQAKRTNKQNFQNTFLAYSISHQAFLSCVKKLYTKNLLQSTFCNQTLYISNVRLLVMLELDV